MNTADTFRTSQEPSTVLLARFQELLKKINLDYGIRWKWVGRSRHGIIDVYDVSRGPYYGVVESEEFERNTQLWKASDTVLGRIHYGSPKYRAVRALVTRLQALSPEGDEYVS